MHEFALARNLVELACSEAAEAGAHRVCRLNCRVGVLRQVDELLMQGAFEIARAGTLCDGATLSIEKTELTARCPSCGQRFAVHEWNSDCPTCGAAGVDFAGGDELVLVSIEVEKDDDDPGGPKDPREE
jgi:hydrogenase nickel incorporation protein HypA/HybF